ncbi:gluconokinase [Polycladomyces subterraneus]|uniref:Gluconokinase n=1 Tax=Polycladomyces subterraneus TaxID=1016997 RepID=A0ABT8INP8_9BACL|nr:gluconokinase [Polycladomyces subterraneus]MDN4594372.1 gluconokinase [Polycladomyces subterraneus]
MTSPSVVIGVDIGTTSTKAVVFDFYGNVLGLGTTGYPLIQPHPGWVEQDPDEIVQAVLNSVRTAVDAADISPEKVTAVGFSAAMHSLIAVDTDGNPLTRAWIWADNRGAEQADQLRTLPFGHECYRRSGTPVHPMSPLVKLLWMKEQEPDLFRRASKFVSIKEYLWYRMFGCWAVDASLASATGLYNLSTRDWDPDILHFIGIAPDRLSPVVPPAEVFTGLQRDCAQRMGLSPDTPFVIGASDGVLANVGVGAIQSGQLAVTVGTSGAVRTAAFSPATDENARTFCYALTNDRWVIGGATNSGGDILRWLSESVFKGVSDSASPSVDRLLSLAESSPPGADGLLFLPFLTGERAPYWDPDARGAWVGLRLHHQTAHLARAALEGVTFTLRAITDAVRDVSGTQAESIRASGGFVRSPFWLQLTADILNATVEVPENKEASAMGAAVLALTAIREMDDLSRVNEWIRITRRMYPDPERVRLYHKWFPLFEETYRRLRPSFQTLSQWQR